MKKRYFFKVYENVDNQVLQTGNTRLELEKGYVELNTKNDDHMALVQSFGGIEVKEEEEKKPEKKSTTPSTSTKKEPETKKEK